MNLLPTSFLKLPPGCSAGSLAWLASLAAALFIPTTASAQLALTGGGTNTFGLTTFATHFPNGGANTVGPIGIGFKPDGGVLVSDDNLSLVFLFPNDANGQNASNVTANASNQPQFPIPTNGFATGIAQLPGPRFFMTRDNGGTVNEIDATGRVLRKVANIDGALGIVAFPPGAGGPLSGYLFVNGSGKIFKVNPDTGATNAVLDNASADGMVFSPDGKTLYAAWRTYPPNDKAPGRILSFNTTTSTWTTNGDTELFGGGNSDGLILGGGTLAGHLYANLNDGTVWELDLPLSTDPALRRIIASGGSRGDFAYADPFNGTMLVTQTDSIKRILPPPGGFFFGAPTSTLLPPGLVYQNDGTGSAVISFSAQPFAGVAQPGGPTWTSDTFTGLSDVLSSPGETFDQNLFIDPNLPGTPGIVPLGLGVSASLPPLFPAPASGGRNFWGGTVAVTPNAMSFKVNDASDPGDDSSSLATAAWTSEFVSGSAFNGNIGTVLALKGSLAPASGVWASLVTYYTDLNSHNSVALVEVLAVSGTTFGNKFAVWTGPFGAPLNGNGWVDYENGGATYTALSAASFPASISAFDRIRQTSVLTVMADDLSLIESADLPTNLNGVTLPDLLLDSTTAPQVQSVALSIQQFGTNVILWWPGGGMLQSKSDLLEAAWTNISGATSPYLTLPSGARAFYRVLVTAAQPTQSYTLTLPNDGVSFVFIANQLDHGSNTLDEIMTNVPDGTFLEKWDCTLQDFSPTNYAFSAFSHHWSPAGGTLVPGEGALIVLGGTGPNPYSLTFTGTPHLPVLPAPGPCGCGYTNWLSRQTNGVGTYENITGLSPQAGAQVQRWNVAAQSTDLYTFSGTAWTPATPMLAVGESAFFVVPCFTNFAAASTVVVQTARVATGANRSSQGREATNAATADSRRTTPESQK